MDKSLTQPALETCGGILVNGQDTHTDIESILESSGGILVKGQDTHTPPRSESTWRRFGERTNHSHSEH